MRTGFFLLLGVLLIAQLLPAQTRDTPPSDTLELAEVVITPTGEQVSSRHVPLPVYILDSKQFERHLRRTIPESLSSLPGVFVQKTNHGGGSPIIRGLAGNQILIMIDGIRFNTATFRYGPNQYLNTIDPCTIQRIEVVPGSGSVQYGTDAIGGVVHLRTTNPEFHEKQQWKGSTQVRIASHGMEYSGMGNLKYGRKKLAFLAGGSFRSFGDLLAGGNTGFQRPSGYRQQAMHGKLVIRPTSNASFTFSHQVLQQERVPLFHKVDLENYQSYLFDPQSQSISYIRMDATTSRPLAKSLRVTGSHLSSREVRSYRKNGTTVSDRDEDKVWHSGLTADILSSILPFWSANSGIEIYQDKVASSRVQNDEQTGMKSANRGLYPDGSEFTQGSVYSLHHLHLNRLDIEGGIRFAMFRSSIPIPDPISMTSSTFHSRPSTWIGNVGALYHLNQYNAISISASSGFRAPNIDDSGSLGLVDFRWEIPTGSLQPERSLNVELGYRLSNPDKHIAVNVFTTRLTDLISRVRLEGQQMNGYQVYTKENSQQAIIMGAEGSLTVRFGTGWALDGSIAYLYGQNQSANEPMRRIPPLHTRWNLGFTRPSFGGDLEFLAAGRQSRLSSGDMDDNRIPEGGTPGWMVVHLDAYWSFGQIDLRMLLQNLTNSSYRTHGSGIPGVGRSVLMGLTIRFGE